MLSLDLICVVPVPDVNITVPDNLNTSQPVTLDCTANTVKGITSTVDIVWYSGVQQMRMVNNVTASIIDGMGAVYRDLFNISSVTNKHDNKVYSCRVIIIRDPVLTAFSSVRLNVTCEFTIKYYIYTYINTYKILYGQPGLIKR